MLQNSLSIGMQNRCSLLISCMLLLAGLCRCTEIAFAETVPQTAVAIHVSEQTQALATVPAVYPTPTGTGTTGYQWWYTWWRYFVAHESLKETLRSDGTPFVVISDSDIGAGKLRYDDGSPRYPVLVSLAAEAISDIQATRLREYVNAGGYLVAGFSSFTRYTDGAPRGNFALSREMGVSMASSSLQNVYDNGHLSRNSTDWLVSHIPSGQIYWRAPFSADEISFGVSPNHGPHNLHKAWKVVANSATVLANGDQGPILTRSSYGKGTIMYHGLFQPLLGHGGFDPSMYAYLIYRKIIDQAFQVRATPMVRVSAWRYPYDAAMLARHDFEHRVDLIKAIEASAAFEHTHGVRGDYFFSTGALRSYTGTDKAEIISSLQRAVSNYGATIGSHNGGLPNPANPLLKPDEYDYWHWGPDEALDQKPAGYTDGKAYAKASIEASFKDIEGWLSGLDNGRPGCGTAKSCPRIWASPCFNSTRTGSNQILEELSGVVSMGEQKIGPFPHWTLSYDTVGRHYSHLSLPVSEWFSSTDIMQTLDDHTTWTVRQAVDLYYDLGALINYYGHAPSNNGAAQQEYITYATSKPRVWKTGSIGVYDWWKQRSSVRITPNFTTSGATYSLNITVSGATDPDTAIDITIPSSYGGTPTILLDGKVAAASEYRNIVMNGIRVRVGNTVSQVTVQNSTNTAPIVANDSYSTNQNTTLTVAAPGLLANDSDPEGAALTAQKVTNPSHGTLTLNSNGSFTYVPITGYSGSDSFTYQASDGSLTSTAATVSITIKAVNQAPIVVNDSYSTSQNTTLTVAAPGLLANDSDPEGAALTAQKVTNPSHGTLNLNSNGSFTYVPTTGYVGNDSFTYQASDGSLTSTAATVTITVTTAALFSDDFTRDPASTDPLSPWSTQLGTMTVADGMLKGQGATSQYYGYAYPGSSSAWTNYTLEARIQLPAGALGGGIGGRLNPSTGAHYGAWVYPDGSAGGSNVLKLIKFRGWTSWSGTPMAQVSLPSVGTGWHTLKLVFNNSRISVYYDGNLMMDGYDGGFDGRAAYLTGGISVDLATIPGFSGTYSMAVDDVLVTAVP